MKLLLLLGLCASVALAADCRTNPIFAAMRGMALNFTMPNASVPATHADFPICTQYNGKEACCSVEMMNGINTAWTAVRSAYNQSEAAMAEGFAMLADILGKAAPAGVLDSIKRMRTALVNSGLTIARHFAGQVCFLCEPDFAKYWSADFTAMYLNTATCDEFWGAMKEFIWAINDFMKALAGALPIPLPKTSICANDDACKTLVCGTMFGTVGFSMSPPSMANGPVAEVARNILTHVDTLLRTLAPANAAAKTEYTATGYNSVAAGKQSGFTGTSGATTVAVSILGAFAAAFLLL